MPKIKLYQIDAFTSQVFGGNPAAVCVLDEWLPDELMQNIAAENNLAETAFVVRKDADFELRWFTPTVEVDLCGHATLAAAYVLFKFYEYPGTKINFYSLRSGLLTVDLDNEELTLDFPADTLQMVPTPEELVAAVGVKPTETYKGKTDYLLVYTSQKEIEEMVPDMRKLAGIAARGIIVSSPGNTVDFVSRFFAPQVGVDEDPVTGSAHTTLTPYWSERLGKAVLTAKQVSRRQGDLTVAYLGDRVRITGRAVAYLQGEIEV
ncbi:PhzF family phenazine biosynthesis protein [Pontibacter sp. SGAir0037]|uniref:PhzF family phenazine biosynthesis protein n=1 Tax=Pontibacter sp. SGAir0037 TaxID=2571030 RepID=UPI0010CD2496|nr:PhzF family phenazine biosynthesis protein [Pontibacter sp. SGAir0037]QCR21049.1 isomerase [Pontibacter sp. SGAir0037]